ncbi:MAG: hypothetical protein JOZ81_00900, partial [Chloroflexi bacterium]|nr:hypothetical protein [Chloroflexota bacterium]
MHRSVIRSLCCAAAVLLVGASNVGAAPGGPSKPPAIPKVPAQAPPLTHVTRIAKPPKPATTVGPTVASRHPSEKPHSLKTLARGSVASRPGAKVQHLRLSASRKATPLPRADEGEDLTIASLPMAQSSPGCDASWSIAPGTVNSDGFPTVDIEGQTNCTPPESLVDNALTLTLGSL